MGVMRRFLVKIVVCLVANLKDNVLGRFTVIFRMIFKERLT